MAKGVRLRRKALVTRKGLRYHTGVTLALDASVPDFALVWKMAAGVRRLLNVFVSRLCFQRHLEQHFGSFAKKKQFLVRC